MRNCLLLTLFALTAFGCTSRPIAPSAAGVLIFVPGVAGDGPWYDSLRIGLLEGGVSAKPQTFSWGAPAPLFAINFNNDGVHDRAEQNLSRSLLRLCENGGTSMPIDVVAHSAGCGVLLGAIRRTPQVQIRTVVLLNPSVSPTYDLKAALAQVGSMSVFHSRGDTTFLQWRTSTFGTYDGIKTAAAGFGGFDLGNLNAAERAKVRQYEHTDGDRMLGHDGGHFGATARPFVRARVASQLANSEVTVIE